MSEAIEIKLKGGVCSVETPEDGELGRDEGSCFAAINERIFLRCKELVIPRSPVHSASVRFINSAANSNPVSPQKPQRFGRTSYFLFSKFGSVLVKTYGGEQVAQLFGV